jgi:hypothetical protein
LSAGSASQIGVPTDAVRNVQHRSYSHPWNLPTPFISLQVTFQAIMKVSAARTHQITVIRPNPLKVFYLLSVSMLEMSKFMLP